MENEPINSEIESIRGIAIRSQCPGVSLHGQSDDRSSLSRLIEEESNALTECTP